MSSQPAPTCAAPPYDDAERGTLNVQVASRPGVVTLPMQDLKDDKKGDIGVSTAVVPVSPVKKDTPAPPPAKKPAKKSIPKWILFQLWYNTYRKLFTIVFGLNMIGLGFTIAGRFPYAANYTGALIVGNLQVCVLMRNELFGRTLFLLVNTLFAKWSPLWWRLICTSVLQHLGGIHSGAGVSGLFWLVYRSVVVFHNHAFVHSSILAFGVLTSCITFLAILSALPTLRNTHHNWFERHHRFLGWSALFSTWIFVLCGDLWNTETRTWNLNGVHVIAQQDFWYVILMTIFIAIPWICTRKVAIDIELPSPKVAVIRFKRGMQQGLLGRISHSAVLEYHAFGIISEGRHAKYHYLICGVQGDFTRSLVNNPPRMIWTRELKFAGVSNTSTLYKRGIRVCTGTGLGAALSTCLQSPYWYLIWIGSDQEKTFGPTISGLIHRHLGPERYCLWDSKQRGGRPDVMKLVKETYVSWQAEVIFITSNWQGNQEIMAGCKEAGIPAFGTLWDF